MNNDITNVHNCWIWSLKQDTHKKVKKKKRVNHLVIDKIRWIQNCGIKLNLGYWYIMSQPGYAGSLISLWIQPELEFQEIPLTELLNRFCVSSNALLWCYSGVARADPGTFTLMHFLL